VPQANSEVKNVVIFGVFRLLLAKELTSEGKIRYFGSQYTKFDTDRSRRIGTGAPQYLKIGKKLPFPRWERISVPAVQQRLESHCIVFLV